MKKNNILKILNPVIALLLLSQICTALLRDVLGDEVFEAIHETGGYFAGSGRCSSSCLELELGEGELF